MANVRIKDLTTTAATTASDDFFGVDGATNGTRKLNAFSPTFGGNLTVSGDVLLPTNSAYRLNGKIALLYNGSNFYIEPNNDLGNIIIGASAQTTYGFTVGGNLTVSGGTITSGSGTLTLNSSANTVVLQSAGTTALTLDSSQRCILSGALRLANTYVATPQVSTGYVTIQDSTGTTYKVLVAT